MAELPALADLTWLDWAVLLLLLIAALGGIARGFLRGTLDLAVGVAALLAAVLTYRQVGALVVRLVELPAGLSILAGFLVALLAAELLLTLAVALLVHLLRPLARPPLVRLDRALGVLPGAAKGLLLTTLLLAPFALFPLLPALSAAIERSALASRLVAAATQVVPDVAELMGPDLAEGLVFLSPPQTEQGLRLPFGALGELAADPDAEAQMLALLNGERSAIGLTPLASDESLRQVARAHSLEMFRRGYFAHDSPDGLTPADRLQRAGIPFGLMGENLAYAPGVQVAHDGLMHSPGHRANILRPEFRRVGIGVIKSQLRGRMFSQEFAD